MQKKRNALRDGRPNRANRKYVHTYDKTKLLWRQLFYRILFDFFALIGLLGLGIGILLVYRLLLQLVGG